MPLANYINEIEEEIVPLKTEYETISLTSAREKFSKVTRYVEHERKRVLFTRHNLSPVSLVPTRHLWIYDVLGELGIDENTRPEDFSEVMQNIHDKSGDWLEEKHE